MLETNLNNKCLKKHVYMLSSSAITLVVLLVDSWKYNDPKELIYLVTLFWKSPAKQFLITSGLLNVGSVAGANL